MLSNRLESIYNLVDDNQITLDVGCDHALLDIALIKNKKSNFAYVCDINQGALNQAIKNIESKKIKNIKPILADGTNIDEISTVTTLIISGLGSDTIISILDKDTSILPNTIILCSNNNYYDIRKYMINIGYCIEREIITKDRGKYYISMKFTKAITKNKINLYIPNTHKDKLFIEYINHIIENKTIIYNSIPIKYWRKKLKLKKIIKIYKRSI